MRYSLYIRRLDYRLLPLILFLMIASLLVLASATQPSLEYGREKVFFTPCVVKQIAFFGLGWVLFFIISYGDYRRLREGWIWIYLGALLLLFGLFFTDPIQNVRRWYRVPGLNFSLQPSEYAKLALVIALSFFLEKKSENVGKISTAVQACALVLVPFLLILKQPDLGTALVLLPMTLVMFYFGGINKKIIRCMGMGGLVLLGFVVCMFLGIFSHEKVKPIATHFMKEYQYERLNPNTYHQKAAQIAIALGSVKGSGWAEADYTVKHWLPFAETDSVFPAFAEQFGFIGSFLLLVVFFGIIFLSFQVTAVAKDLFGRLLSSGIAVYLAIHVIINIGMMCGLLPITGVPLVLMSSGGSSVLATMIALGLLQSVYVRRYMF